jgi:membrane-associated phospholipid phosphatase
VAVDAAQSGGPPAGAETSQAERRSPSLLRSIAGDFRNVFTRRENLLVAGIGGGLALGAAAFDHRIARSSLNSEFQEETTLDRAFEAGDPLGDWSLHAGGALAAYATGKLFANPATEDLGRDLIRAQVVSGALTSLLKVAIRRERPDASSRSSFPSGHASAAFATAAVIQRHHGMRAGIPAHLIAGYVAGSRLNEGTHYLSDALFGAAVGIVSGRMATLDAKPRLVSPWIGPGGVGIQIAFGDAR